MVKVRRSGLTIQVVRDLDIVGRLVETLQRSTNCGRNIGAAGLPNGFAKALREEFDLRAEARNIAVVTAASEARGGDPGVHLPVVYPAISSERVLVMEGLISVCRPLYGRRWTET